MDRYAQSLGYTSAAEIEAHAQAVKLAGSQQEVAASAEKVASSQAKAAVSTKGTATAFEQLTGHIGRAVQSVLLYGTAFQVMQGVESIVADTAKEIFSLSDATYKLSQISGIEATQASALINVAKERGVEADKLTAALGHLEVQQRMLIGAEEQGRKAGVEFAAALQAVGVSTTTTAGAQKDSLSLLYDIADAFKSSGDSAAAFNAASKAFGESAARDLIPVLALGSQGLKDLSRIQAEYGNTVTPETVKRVRELEAATKDMNSAFAGTKLVVGQQVVPVVGALAQELDLLSAAFAREHGATKDSAAGLDNWTKAGLIYGTAIDEMTRATAGFGEVVVGVATHDLKLIQKGVTDVSEAGKKAGEDLYDQLHRIAQQQFEANRGNAPPSLLPDPAAEAQRQKEIESLLDRDLALAEGYAHKKGQINDQANKDEAGRNRDASEQSATLARELNDRIGDARLALSNRVKEIRADELAEQGKDLDKEQEDLTAHYGRQADLKRDLSHQIELDEKQLQTSLTALEHTHTLDVAAEAQKQLDIHKNADQARADAHNTALKAIAAADSTLADARADADSRLNDTLADLDSKRADAQADIDRKLQETLAGIQAEGAQKTAKVAADAEDKRVKARQDADAKVLSAIKAFNEAAYQTADEAAKAHTYSNEEIMNRLRGRIAAAGPGGDKAAEEELRRLEAVGKARQEKARKDADAELAPKLAAIDTEAQKQATAAQQDTNNSAAAARTKAELDAQNARDTLAREDGEARERAQRENGEAKDRAQREADQAKARATAGETEADARIAREEKDALDSLARANKLEDDKYAYAQGLEKQKTADAEAEEKYRSGIAMGAEDTRFALEWKHLKDAETERQANHEKEIVRLAAEEAIREGTTLRDAQQHVDDINRATRDAFSDIEDRRKTALGESEYDFNKSTADIYKEWSKLWGDASGKTVAGAAGAVAPPPGAVAGAAPAGMQVGPSAGGNAEVVSVLRQIANMLDQDLKRPRVNIEKAEMAGLDDYVDALRLLGPT